MTTHEKQIPAHDCTHAPDPKKDEGSSLFESKIEPHLYCTSAYSCVCTKAVRVKKLRGNGENIYWNNTDAWFEYNSTLYHTTKGSCQIEILLHVAIVRFIGIVSPGMIFAGADATGFETRHCTPYYSYRCSLGHSFTKLSAGSDMKIR